ncbi:MAG: hypothetical protein HC905_14895 [Bacteroidales bacterium]|nr:hypothetical protein [Bacteroidales bacterium]
MYILWTIESIRAVANDSEYLVGRFPSQNPILEKKDFSELFIHSQESHEIVSKAYYDWWNSNKRKDFDSYKNIDPLRNTVYKWH